MAKNVQWIVSVIFLLFIFVRNIEGTCKNVQDWTVCENMALKANIPLQIANPTRKLKLGAPVEKLPPRIFVNLSHLETLAINYTLMLKIDRDSFAGLTNLQELDLFWNQIPEIPSGVFLYCPDLIYLNLGGNNLETLNGDTVRHLKRLKKLILSYNLLTNVPNLPNLERLQEIDLGYNKIKTVTKGSFYQLPNLIKLKLKGNQINFLEEGAFEHLLLLEHLNLEKNQIKTLNLEDVQESLPKLNEIGININSFTCEELQRIVDGFVKMHIFIPEGLAEPGPISYHGIFCLVD